MDAKKHADGWQIRCTKCDFAEPWTKSVSGTKRSGGRKFIFGRCPNCKRIRFRVIEQIPHPNMPVA